MKQQLLIPLFAMVVSAMAFGDGYEGAGAFKGECSIHGDKEQSVRFGMYGGSGGYNPAFITEKFTIDGKPYTLKAIYSAMGSWHYAGRKIDPSRNFTVELYEGTEDLKGKTPVVYKNAGRLGLYAQPEIVIRLGDKFVAECKGKVYMISEVDFEKEFN